MSFAIRRGRVRQREAVTWSGMQKQASASRLEPRSCCSSLYSRSTTTWGQVPGQCTHVLRGCAAPCQLVPEGLAQVTPKLREMARAALTTWPAIAFGIANGLYHFCFYREDGLGSSVASKYTSALVKDWDPDAGLPPSAMLNIEDMVLAEQLLQAFSLTQSPSCPAE